MGHHLILEAVMAGNTHAMVYADDTRQPRVALCRYKDRFYLAGEADAEFGLALKTHFHETIFPAGQAEGREAFVVYYAPDACAEPIMDILEGRKSWQGQRSYFALKRLERDWRELMPDGITIRPIDEMLLSQTHLNHLDELIEEIQSERDSVSEFLAKSFGFCAVAGDDIAGLCTSEFNNTTRCEVGIMTMEGYQRRGIASALACALADHAFANGFNELGWHCWAKNTPSVATALKVGFQHVCDYPAIVGWYGRDEQA
jgi:GNAT superfamily N-acetyltransferase